MIALGLPLGVILLGVLFRHGAIFVIGLLAIFLLPVPLLCAALYLSSRGRPGDSETAAGIWIGPLIIALFVVQLIEEGGRLASLL